MEPGLFPSEAPEIWHYTYMNMQDQTQLSATENTINFSVLYVLPEKCSVLITVTNRIIQPTHSYIYLTVDLFIM